MKIAKLRLFSGRIFPDYFRGSSEFGEEFKVWSTWCSDGEFKPAHPNIPGGLTLRGWADNRLGPVLGGPSRTLPSGNQLPYPAYTSWVSRVDVQFVDAACWQHHVGAFGQAETGRGRRPRNFQICLWRVWLASDHPERSGMIWIFFGFWGSSDYFRYFSELLLYL